MIIPALVGKFKADGVIHLDELINMYGESLFGSEWMDNIYTQNEPFYGVFSKKKSHNRVEVTISSYIMAENKPERYKPVFSFPHDELKHLSKAHEMIIGVRQKLWTILYKDQLPFKAVVGSITVESDDIDRAIWSAWKDTILCTGYFPVTKRGKRRWGLLEFEKEKVLDSLKNIKGAPSLIQNKLQIQLATDENVGGDDDLDPRITKSLLKIILAMSIKDHRTYLVDGNSHTIGKKISDLAVRYGFKIDKKTVAKIIDMAKKLPEWNAHLDYQKDANIKKVQ